MSGKCRLLASLVLFGFGTGYAAAQHPVTTTSSGAGTSVISMGVVTVRGRAFDVKLYWEDSSSWSVSSGQYYFVTYAVIGLAEKGSRHALLFEVAPRSAPYDSEDGWLLIRRSVDGNASDIISAVAAASRPLPLPTPRARVPRGKKMSEALYDSSEVDLFVAFGNPAGVVVVEGVN